MTLKIEKIILEVHDFLANTTRGNKGGKYYIKEMEKIYWGEQTL